MAYRYRLQYRPLGLTSAVTSLGARLIETGTGGFYPARRDLPMGDSQFGVVSLPVRLNREERERLQVTYDGDDVA